MSKTKIPTTGLTIYAKRDYVEISSEGEDEAKVTYRSHASMFKECDIIDETNVHYLIFSGRLKKTRHVYRIPHQNVYRIEVREDSEE